MADVWGRLETAVKAARGRTLFEPERGGMRAGRNLVELRRLRALIDELIEVETVRGRRQGAPWSRLGPSKQAAHAAFRRAAAKGRVETA